MCGDLIKVGQGRPLMSDTGAEVSKEAYSKANCYLGGECSDRGDSKGKGL